MKKVILILLIISFIFGHIGDRDHRHYGHNRHYEKYWSTKVKFHMGYNKYDRSTKYWRHKYMDMREDFKGLWVEYNTLNRDYNELVIKVKKLETKLSLMPTDFRQ